MNSRECNSTPQQELEQAPCCTLSGLAQDTHLSQCSCSAQCPSARFPLSTKAVCLWLCMRDRMLSELLLPLHTWLWAQGLIWLTAVDTLTADRPTVLSTHLCPHALRHVGSTHVPKRSANHAAVCTAMHLCACCINSVPFP